MGAGAGGGGGGGGGGRPPGGAAGAAGGGHEVGARGDPLGVVGRGGAQWCSARAP